MKTETRSLLSPRQWLEGRHNQAGLGNEKIRAAWLKQVLERIPPGSRILDAGAGELRWKPLCAHLNYVSQDFAQYDGRGDSTGIQTGAWDQTKLDIVSDITAIPEPDESFDAIMCIEVLEHLPEPVKALAEFSRLLKKGGRLVMTAPFCSLTHFAPYHFSTGFNRYFYEHHLPALGFEILELTPNGNYFEFVAQEIRRVPEMAAKYAGGGPSVWERAVLGLALRVLARFSRRDKGSEELLHYDFQVLAVKK